MLTEITTRIIAVAVGAAIQPLFTKVIYPWFVEWFREPTKLAKEFHGILDFGRGPNHEIVLRPKKCGYKVTGTLRFVKGEHAGKEYKILGRYHHGLLSFYYSAVNKASTSEGSATFKRMNDGDLFQGHFIYFSQSIDSLGTVECTLKTA